MQWSLFFLLFGCQSFDRDRPLDKSIASMRGQCANANGAYRVFGIVDGKPVQDVDLEWQSGELNQWELVLSAASKEVEHLVVESGKVRQSEYFELAKDSLVLKGIRIPYRLEDIPCFLAGRIPLTWNYEGTSDTRLVSFSAADNEYTFDPETRCIKQYQLHYLFWRQEITFCLRTRLIINNVVDVRLKPYE